jgi:cyanophycinase
MKQILFPVLISLILLSTLYSQTNKGALVIVGGGLEHNNEELFSELINLSGGFELAKFAIIPAASGDPIKSYEYFKNELISYKIKPENISLVKLAIVDDDSTKMMDESLWKGNGNDPEILKTIKNSTCIWFSGGDQLRITETLFNSDGSETEALKEIRKVYKNGGVIGGTSAGAAIMSERMIGSGTAFSSLKFGIFTDKKYKNLSADSGVYLTKGLGFFGTGMVDQHFNERARLARLIMAMFNSPKINKGFGIDENTALVYYGTKNEFSVLGTGGVTCLDLSNAELSMISGMPKVKNIQLSYLSSGDRYNLNTGEIIPDKRKELITGKETNDDKDILQSDILTGCKSNYYTVITHDLIDNKGVKKIENLNLMGNNLGYSVMFTKTDQSFGYYAEYPNENEKYTVIKIIMDMIPVKILYTPIKID